MKNLKTLAKELDFNTEQDYFDYCIDSHINGNFSQCEELFKAMKKEDRKVFLQYLNGQAQNNGGRYLEIRNYYFNLL